MYMPLSLKTYRKVKGILDNSVINASHFSGLTNTGEYL